MRTRPVVLLLLACALPASAQPGSVISIDGRDWNPPGDARPAPARPERNFPPPEPAARGRGASSSLGPRWEGFYAGANAGVIFHSFHTDDVDYLDSFDRSTLHAAGGAPGVKLGWNWVRGAVLLGLEAGYDWDIGARAAHKPRLNGNTEFGANMTDLASVRLRAGGLINEQVLVYGAAGPVYARGIQTYEAVVARWKSRGWHGGLAFGGGFEFGLADRVTLSTEYLRAVFMPRTAAAECIAGAGTCNAATQGTRYKFAPELDLLRLGVNFHF